MAHEVYVMENFEELVTKTADRRTLVNIQRNGIPNGGSGQGYCTTTRTETCTLTRECDEHGRDGTQHFSNGRRQAGGW